MASLSLARVGYYNSIIFASINFDEGYDESHLYGLYFGSNILSTTEQLSITLYDVTDSITPLFKLYQEPTDKQIVTFISSDKRSIVTLDRSALVEGDYAINKYAALNSRFINNYFDKTLFEKYDLLNNSISANEESIKNLSQQLLLIEQKEKTDSINVLYKVYCYASSKQFFQNQYTNNYIYSLYKLEPDKYYELDYSVSKIENAALVAGYIEKESDLAVGGKVYEVIISGADFGKKLTIFPKEERFLVLLGNSSNPQPFAILKEEVKRKSLKEAVQEISNENIVEKPKLCCPDKFFAVVGEEFNIYYDSLIKALDAGLSSPFGIYIDIQCPDLQNASNKIGVRRERMWQIESDKLTASYIGNHNLKIMAYDQNGKLIDQKIVTLTVSNANPLSLQKYILCIGDSLTNNGPIVSTCAQHFSKIGGLQPIFIGQRSTSGYKHEGYPGYTFDSFVSGSGGYTYKIFDIPENTNVSVGDKYSTNEVTYTNMDIRTEGLDSKLRIRCERNSGTNEPSYTGILTKVSGKESSAEMIEYSSYESESGNPFWDEETGANNFTKYRKKMNMAENKFDIVVIMLGTNDCIGNIRASMQGSVNSAKTLINAILSDAGSYATKIILQMTPPDSNTISSWQVYSDNLNNNGNKMGYWTNLWNLRALLYEEFTKSEWEGKVFLGQAAIGLDRYYGFPYTEVKSSSRLGDITEIYHTNSVHPNVKGYEQLGDGYYLQIKYLL